MDLDLIDLGRRWTAAFGEGRPINYELRSCLHHRWVRFHSLPESKRYAENESEYVEIIARHQTVVDDLLQEERPSSGTELLVLTPSWSDSPEPEPPPAELVGLMPARYWKSILTDDSVPGDSVWTHVWVSVCSQRGANLAQFLRLVADDVIGGVIVTSARLTWLYAPYDGGADVIATTVEQRDALRGEHHQWLPVHPSGL